MKNHTCSKCGNTVYFENVQCVKCGADLGFDPERLAMITIEPLAEPPGAYRPIGQEDEQNLDTAPTPSTPRATG